jgi:hypothetical protein
MKGIVTILLCLYSITSFACDCASISVKEGVNSSDLVVKATVVKIELKQFVLTKTEKDSIEGLLQRKIFNDTINFYEYTFKVEKTLKSTEIQDTIIVRSGSLKSNCDIHFSENTTYLLYASESSMLEEKFLPKSSLFPVFYSSICTRTTANWKKEMRLFD